MTRHLKRDRMKFGASGSLLLAIGSTATWAGSDSLPLHMGDSSTYAAAKRRARKEFGVNGHVVVSPIKSLLSSYQVGTYIGGRFVVLGTGQGWDEAFLDAKKREVAK